MSFLAGLAKAVQEEDQQAHEKYMFDEKIKEDRKAMLMDLSAKRQASLGSGSKSKTTVAEAAAAVNLMVKNGLSQDKAAELLATGDYDGVMNLKAEYERRAEEYAKSNQVHAAVNPDLFVELLNDTQVQGAQTSKLFDKDALRLYGIDDETAEEYSSMTYTTPGAVVTTKRPIGFQMNAREIQEWKELIKENVTEGTSSTMYVLSEKAKELANAGKIGEGTAHTWITTEIQRLEGVGDKLNKTSNVADAVRETGQVFTAYEFFIAHPQLSNVPDFKNIKDAMGQTRLSIPTEELAAELARTGALSPGTVYRDGTGQMVMYLEKMENLVQMEQRGKDAGVHLLSDFLPAGIKFASYGGGNYVVKNDPRGQR